MVFESGKRFNRRRLVAGTALSAAALSAKSSSTFAAASLLKQSSDITLELWSGVAPENGPQAVVDAFREIHPEVSVNITRYVNDDTGNTQLDTALQAGQQIDLFFTYSVPRLGQRISAGAALDISSYIEGDAEINEWTTATDGIFTYEGKYYSLPTCSEPHYIFANKNHLDDAGITVPESGWTIDEFHEMSKQLSGDNAFGAFQPPDTARMTLGQDYWFKEGGTESNFDDPAFREWIQLHRDMVDEGSSFPWADVVTQDLQLFGQHGVFLTEQISLWPNASWVMGQVRNSEDNPRDFVTTFAPLPVPGGVENPWNPGGINNWLQVNSKTENPDMAWEFLRFFLTDGAQFMLQAGKIPAFMGDTTDEAILEGTLGPNRDELFDVDAYLKVIFDSNIRMATDSITTGTAEITQILRGLTDRCLLGEIEVDEWVQESKAQSDEAINRALA